MVLKPYFENVSTGFLFVVIMYEINIGTGTRRVIPWSRIKGGGVTLMLYHATDHHVGLLGLGDGVGYYKLEVEGVFRDLMTRQVGEDARMSL